MGNELFFRILESINYPAMKNFLFSAFLMSSFGLFGQNATTEIMTYTSGEFLGSCRVVFTRVSGEEMIFWNPDLGDFADEQNPCLIANQYQDTPFEITWQMGSTEVYMEEVGSSVIETEIMVGIQLAE